MVEAVGIYDCDVGNTTTMDVSSWSAADVVPVGNTVVDMDRALVFAVEGAIVV